MRIYYHNKLSQSIFVVPGCGVWEDVHTTWWQLKQVQPSPSLPMAWLCTLYCGSKQNNLWLRARLHNTIFLSQCQSPPLTPVTELRAKYYTTEFSSRDLRVGCCDVFHCSNDQQISISKLINWKYNLYACLFSFS